MEHFAIVTVNTQCAWGRRNASQVLVPFSRGTQTVRSTRSSSYKIQKTRSASTIHDDCLSIAEATSPLLLLPPPPANDDGRQIAALGELAPRAIMRSQPLFDERYVGDAAAARRLEALRAGSLKLFDEFDDSGRA